MITAPGYYDIPMADYIADPAPEPSISTTTVHDLIQRTPMHAHHGHPRLGGNGSDSTSRGELGSAVHANLFGGARVVYATAEFEDWRKGAAREFRDNARALGELPLLAHQRSGVEQATVNAKAALEGFGPGRCEQTLLFQVEGAWARGRADYLTDDGLYDIDAKTCDNADPSDYARTIVMRSALDVQMGLRSLGHKALGQPRKMLWLLIEIEAPYACSIAGVAPSLLALAEQKVQWAACKWRECLDAQVWPGYPRQIYWVDAPTYAQMDFASRTGVVPA